ncbi:MAG: DUF502 domain-containing protein [Planctomycetes bacterium]|nr:DUF502 domain-containing protein [Planctomycetota bacterium]
MRSTFRTFMQGIIVTTPAVLTVYVCFRAMVWLDSSVRSALKAAGLPAVPGLGVVLAFAGIYLVGLAARNWIFRKLVDLGEAIVERIPLVKSLYSSVKDLLQFLGGTDARTRGVPARISLRDDTVHMLGLITQKEPEKTLGKAEKDRVAVYLPMSYQLGGFTVYVDEGNVEEIEGMSVEDLLKTSLTAGIGTPGETENAVATLPGPDAKNSEPEAENA